MGLPEGRQADARRRAGTIFSHVVRFHDRDVILSNGTVLMAPRLCLVRISRCPPPGLAVLVEPISRLNHCLKFFYNSVLKNGFGKMLNQ